jgi:hypothetical protein
MRLGRVTCTALLAASATCLGDEASFLLPAALAARVDVEARGGQTIAVEVQRDGVLVTVSEAMRALAGAASSQRPLEPGYAGAATLDVPSAFELPRELVGVTDAASRPFDVFARLVEFVSSRITIDENDLGPQDAASVLRRGRGRCSGRANLAVGLLRAAGIPARVVLGVTVGEHGARWHRWGEAWLGAPGWVAFDPGTSLGLVSVRYLPLTGAGEGTPLSGVRVQRIDERGFLSLRMRSGMRVLPVGGATVRLVAPSGQPDLTALLFAPDGSRWARRGRGSVTFGRMLPGRYRLVWLAAGRPSALELEIRDEREVRVALPEGTEAGT